jgi:hypothetical protein
MWNREVCFKWFDLNSNFPRSFMIAEEYVSNEM